MHNMDEAPYSRLPRASVRRLEELGVVPGVAARLEAASDRFVAELVRKVAAEVPAFEASGNPEVMPGLERHLKALVGDVVGLLRGARPGDFAWVSAYAETRADQKFPLDALLQAYRAVHQRLANWIRDAALEAADEHAQLRRVVAAVSEFTIDYLGLIGPLLTARYVDHTRQVAEAEGDRRLALLNLLLDGYDEADARAARLLRAGGYLEQRQSYCVVVARSVNAAEMENPARAQRMANAIVAELAPARIRTIVGIRDNRVYVLLSATRRLSGWTAPQSLLADRVYPLLRRVGTAALIGLSADVPSTAHIPKAAAQALFALESATVADRVLSYARIPFAKLLVAHAGEELKQALPAWTSAFNAANAKSKGRLGDTLGAYADANMNAQKAAEALGIHANTLYARVRRIEDVTGLNPLAYHALTELLLALDCAESGADRAPMAQ